MKETRQRKRLGLIYTYDERWIGGTYYIINLIKALNGLKDEDKPSLFVFTHEAKDFVKLKDETKYPYITYWPLVLQSRWGRAINKFTRAVLKKNIIDNRPKGKDLDLLFPSPYGPFFSLYPAEQIVHWIPDFQEEHLPAFFSADEINSRKNSQREISETGRMVVFSSNDARQDFERLFPTSKIRKQIVRFAVSHDPSYLTLDADKLRAKYNLPEIFFIAPNQFWAHKNHKTIVLAMEKLIAEGHSITLVFTGKEDDYRNPEYTTQIKSLVKEKGLESAIRFLGFIPRNDLLRLIDLALAVVQPSLFEGWSTVVEDSKALNKFIIASSIAVHREQLSSYLNHSLFSPENASDLADRMRDAMIQGSALIKEKYDYQADIDSYGKNVLQLFDHITN